jgi:hypothetical protein
MKAIAVFLRFPALLSTVRVKEKGSKKSKTQKFNARRKNFPSPSLFAPLSFAQPISVLVSWDDQVFLLFALEDWLQTSLPFP